MTSAVFGESAIDIIKTQEKLVAAGYGKPVYRARFGLQIVRLAEKVVHTHFDYGSAKGVVACLEQLICSIQVETNILGVALWREPLFSVGVDFGERKKVRILAVSLVLTVVAYRSQLNERHTNLAQIRFGQLLTGFERLCYWVSRYASLEQKSIPELSYLDMEQTLGWLER